MPTKIIVAGAPMDIDEADKAAYGSMEDDTMNSNGTRESKRNKSKKNDDDEVEFEDDDPSEDFDDVEANEEDVEEDLEELGIKRRSRRVASQKGSSTTRNKRGSRAASVAASKKSNKEERPTRTSSRSTKFQFSMAEPTGIKDLMEIDEAVSSGRGKREGRNQAKRSSGQRNSRSRSASSDEVILDSLDDDDDDAFLESKVRSRGQSKRSQAKENVATTNNRRSSSRTRAGRIDSLQNVKASPHKPSARRHSKARRTVSSRKSAASSSEDESDDPDDEDASVDSHASDGDNEAEGDDDEPPKLQRILACRSEKLSTWKEIGSKMNTQDVTNGSVWDQEEINAEDEDRYEERFLCKWKDMSYLHCSWETQKDLEEQVDGTKTYLNTFFRKSHNGILFTADERCDGDYFDPAFTTIERIVEVEMPELEEGSDKKRYPPLKLENEDKATPEDFGVILDKSDPNYKNSFGRQFFIKWENQPYTEMTWENERDLVMNDIEYKEPLKAFLKRNKKPTKSQYEKDKSKGEKAFRQAFKTFNENTSISQERKDAQVAEFQQDLQAKEYRNGGQLRDYQVDGVSWMIANFCNNRSVILADEMGLGKTLQTAATVDMWTKDLRRVGPVLIIAPLSTLAHWKREFEAWTDLNTIIYHGSEEDRKLLRNYEFVYECDRPETELAFNQTYLKKCVGKGKKKKTGFESPWMVDVVITTPEMVTCDDSVELSAVDWEILVVDEAHRLKNHKSKLTVRLKDNKFSFNHHILLTGTPIQNNLQEFWTLLNFIHPDAFPNMEEFVDKYGMEKGGEGMAELHEVVKPYMLRRLKEDVEKSVPPKEETLIEVELTIAQKQYYRALYEKNGAFLNKGKRAIDGPSLNNIAMQLRKCCNHLFLLNGVEQDFRRERVEAGEKLPEADLLVKASGKLVLLDKLLPRLKEQGHRLLIFSQFKIMLDVLEDYLYHRNMKFERIDGSITGHKRQQAIDRFQSPSVEGKDAPFIMLLSTRAGGVGINLTAADTVIIFDSDFNPQNDLQAQARCHRIGQTKNVKVYRLLTRKTYEMQLFHMSSLKMGLDQAVLRGFESGSSGEGGLSKQEVEDLLKKGAYDIFTEDKAGTSESESNNFIEQDIDTILLRHSKTVVHENTGSTSNAAGGTFSKASFKAARSPGAAGVSEDIDVNDPEFWKKILPENSLTAKDEDIMSQPRKRAQVNYSEAQIEAKLFATGESSAEDSDPEEDEDIEEVEEEGARTKWGGMPESNEWKKDHAEAVVNAILTFGYGNRPWEDMMKQLDFGNSKYKFDEVKRMFFSLSLVAILEAVEEEATQVAKREASIKKDSDEKNNDGGVLANMGKPGSTSPDQLRKNAMQKIWLANKSWAMQALEDAISFGKQNDPRPKDLIEKTLRPEKYSKPELMSGDLHKSWMTVWKSLENRGWKVQTRAKGKDVYEDKDGKVYLTYESVLSAAKASHPNLEQMCASVLSMIEEVRSNSLQSQKKENAVVHEVKVENVEYDNLRSLVEQYAPLQLLADRRKSTKIRLPRKILNTCNLMRNAFSFVKKANATAGDSEGIDRLTGYFAGSKAALPHPLWTPKHDAILVHAITKHGWIDQDTRLRAIADDPLISWGAPFEPGEESQEEKAHVEPHEDAAELQNTASRAAAFLSTNKEFLAEVKGFDDSAVKRAFCLKKESVAQEVVDVDNPDLAPPSVQAASHTWTVDKDALLGSYCNDTSGKLTRLEPVDLPTTKDLQKRAKTILARSPGNIQGSEIKNEGSKANTSHGFTVLDQTARCNTLLAELLRGLLKSPSSKGNHNRKFLQFAIDEVRARTKDVRDLLSKAQAPQSEALTKSQSALEQITRHMVLIQRNFRHPKQYKNVLRVILGDEPHQGRSPEESIFPSEKSAEPPATVKPSVKASKPRKALNPEASGDLAIEAARRLLLSRTEEENGEILSASCNYLELTEVEVLILSVACSMGLPVWKEGGVDVKSRGSYAWTWNLFGQALAKLGKELFKLEKDKYSKIVQEEDAKGAGKSEYILWNAEKTFFMKESARDQAADYASEPQTLAKKTIMMVAKVIQHARSAVSTNSLPKEYLGPGSKEMAWLDQDITKWAKHLDLLDTQAKPLAFTAIDFVDDIPDTSRIEISAIMDKNGCCGVMSQVCVITRLRAILLLDEGKSKLLQKTGKSLVSSLGKDVSSELPQWWGPYNGVGLKNMGLHDSLLLERLLDSGFAEVLDNDEDYGILQVAAAKTSFRKNELTKSAIQCRASQLASTMHSLQPGNGVSSLRVLEEIRQKRVEHKSGTAVHKASVQSGISSYFRAAENRPEADHASGSDSDVEVIENQHKGSGRGTPPALSESPSPKKKARVSS